MSNTDTPTPDSYIAVDWRYSLERIHEIARVENRHREVEPTTTDSLLFLLAQAQIERNEFQRRSAADVDAGDYRAHHLWEKLYAALNGDIEQDETWGLIMDEIPGVPDLRVRSFEVEIPLDTLTITVDAKDEDEAIEMAMELAENDYCIEDVMQQRYIEAREA